MKTILTSFRFLTALTFLTGILYPGIVTGLAYLCFKRQATGSLLTSSTGIVGSELIAQCFSDPKYFWPRPSTNKYDGLNSAGSNLSVNAPDLVKLVQDRELAGFILEMRFASASGLDPHISPEAAEHQLERISKARGFSSDKKLQLKNLLMHHVESPQLGFLGEPRVNVLRLNQSLDQL